jgi:O-antigen ligase
MASRIRSAVAPLYLLLCLLLGGSAQAIWGNMVLELLGVAILAWAALGSPSEPLSREQSQLFALAIAAVVVVVLQLIPLPPAVWEHLGARHSLADGYRVLGIAVPWLPVSLTPYESAATLLTLIPPIALFAAIARLGPPRPLLLVLALLAGTLAGILLGALQVGSTDPATSPWYLYSRTNFGVATGFFANANHMATLLVISVPFLAALLASARGAGRDMQRYSAAVALVAGAALIVIVGLALNGSLAGYGLAVPVLFASALLVVPARRGVRRWLAAVGAVLLVAALAVLVFSPLQGESVRSNAASSVASRHEISATTARAAGDFMPLGSGLGSFRSVYGLYEDHDRLDPTAVVNHAHDDYLELVLELGVPGVILTLLFLVWWGRAVWRAWTRSDAGPYAKAATIASAAILAHSLVDFPLRTAAIGACFALCLGLQSWRRPAPPVDQSRLWPTRHVVLG